MPMDIRKFFNKAENHKPKSKSKSEVGVTTSASATGAATLPPPPPPSRRNRVDAPSKNSISKVNKSTASPVTIAPTKKTKKTIPSPVKSTAKKKSKRHVFEDSEDESDEEQLRVSNNLSPPSPSSGADISANSVPASSLKRKSDDSDEESAKRTSGGNDPVSSPTKKTKTTNALQSSKDFELSPVSYPNASGRSSNLQPINSETTRSLSSQDFCAGSLTGLAFCFSGELETLSREQSTDLIKELGGRVTSAVSGKTDYLVVGENLEDGRPFKEGSKYKKALQHKTTVVRGEVALLDLLVAYDAKASKNTGVSSLQGDGDHGIESIVSGDVGLKSQSSLPQSSLTHPSDAASVAKVQSSLSLGSSVTPIVAGSNITSNPYAKKIKSNPYGKKSPSKFISEADRLPSKIKTEFNESNSLLWVDKYKPTNSKDIMGNQENVRQLSLWLHTWESKFNTPSTMGKSFSAPSGPKKAALLSGPPGIGKTTTAVLVANESGRDVIEFNASDVRSKAALGSDLGDISGSRTLEFLSKSGKKSKPRTKRCIIMDEVDGMGGGDRGGVASLIQLIKNSLVPIICICNDRQSQKIKSLLPYCLDLRYRRPVKSTLAKRAIEIASREGLIIEPNAAEAIAESCGNDVRQVINAIQMWSNDSSNGDRNESGNHMTYKQLKARQHEINKDEILRVSLFDAAKLILEGRKGLGSNSDSKAEKDHFFKRDDAFYVDYNFVGLLVQQNYLKVVQGDFLNAVRTQNDNEKVKILERMSQAADSMSDYDLVSTTIMRSQNWTLLPFSSLSTVKTGYHASGENGGFLPGFPEFTAFLGKNSSRGKNNRLLQEIQYHINYHVNGGTFELRTTYLPMFRIRFWLFLNHENSSADGIREAIDLMDEYGLDRDDVMEKLDEFTLNAKDDTFLFSNIDSKRKAAFTRAYNERAHKSQALVSEQQSAPLNKSKRASKASVETMSETLDLYAIDEDRSSEGGEEKEEENEELEDDEATFEKIRSMFKPSRKSKASNTKKSMSNGKSTVASTNASSKRGNKKR